MRFPKKQDIEKLDAAERKSKLVSLAEQYMEIKGCRWSEACPEVKRRYGDPAREAFNAPPARA